jgi:hypothetical protein
MPDRAVIIGANLSAEEDSELVRFLNKNKDVFAWSAKDLQEGRFSLGKGRKNRG